MRRDESRAASVEASKVEAVLERTAKLAARLMSAPAAFVSLTGRQRQWLEAGLGQPLRMGLDESAVPPLTNARPLLAGDLAADSELAGRLQAAGIRGARCLLAVPLLGRQERVLGQLCVVDTSPRPEVSAADLEALTQLAETAVDHLYACLELQAHRQTEQELRLCEAVVAETSDQVMILRAPEPVSEEPGGDLVVHYANDAVLKRLGLTFAEVEGRSLTALGWQDLNERAPGLLRATLAAGQPARLELQLPGEDGAAGWTELSLAPVRTQAGAAPRFWIATGRDVTLRKQQEAELHAARGQLERHVGERTRALQELNQQLEHDASHDALTGLPNRALFNLRLQQAIDRVRSGQSAVGASFALLFLDCDRFKVINDTLGHSVGDALLTAFSRRLQSLVREGSTVARLGGDEFSVLLEDLDAAGSALRVAERVQRACSTPFYVGPHVLHIGASIGIVTSAEGHHSADDVMRDADIAMYRAKGAGRGRSVQFDVDMREKTVNQMRLEGELRAALLRDELAVFFQPIVDIGSGELHGFEALVRWPHEERGMVGPDDFIPLAEETGLIVELDRWVLFEACRRMMEWRRMYPWTGRLSLSVNMSTHQFTRTDFLETAELVLHASDFPASHLRVEITESVVMQRSEQVMTNLLGLRALGAQLHVDDFGTGYSSLSYLQQFAPDALKIDRAFVTPMLERAESAELVRTILSLAHNLGLAVVAEGVETPEQLGPLQTYGCEYAQGYYFSRPLDAQAATELLERETARSGARKE